MSLRVLSFAVSLIVLLWSSGHNSIQLPQPRIDRHSSHSLMCLADNNYQEAFAQNDTQSFQQALDDMKKTADQNRFLLYMLLVAIVVIFFILHLINKRKRAWTAKELSEKQMMKAEIERLRKQVHLIVHEKEGSAPEAEKEVVNRLTDLIEGQKLYLNKDISRALIAQQMGCSQQTMTKMLNEIQPDLSFPDYIKSLRITYALNLIKESPDLTVQQISDASGFYSISSFERSFKAVTGKTPRQYIKETVRP